MLERVTQKEFCEILEGQFATTEVDRSGEKFTREALEKIEQQIRDNPERRIMVANHDSSHKIGEILEVNVEDEKDHTVLRGKFGIFEDEREILSKIKSGELSGLSVSVEQFENTDPNEWEAENPNLTITADPQFRSDIYELLKEQNLRYRSVTQKSAEAVAIFEIVAENADTLVTAVIAVHQWYQNNADTDNDGISVEVSGDNNTIEIPDKTEDELKQELEDNIED